MYGRIQQNRRITVVRYEHTLKIRPDILKMAAILFCLVLGVGHLEWLFLAFTLRNQIVDENVFRQHAVTVKIYLFNFVYLENINLILGFIINIISQPIEFLNISSALIV